jgi:DNA polymerase-1
MSEEKKPVLIVDGDILAFTVGRATEDYSDFGDQLCSSFSEEDAIKLLDDGIQAIADKCGYDREDIIYSISCAKNYRKRFFPTYKSNRKDVVKPLGLKFIREHLLANTEKYNLFMIEELEADDCMGIAGTSGDPNISIYSQDKDLRTIPVRQWDFKKGKFWTPTYDQAMKWLYTQVLTGDTVDGYKGCPKIGKVKAEKALANCSNDLELLEQVFVRYYMAYDKDIDIAKEKSLEQFGQARILHHTDFMELKQNDKTFNPYEILGVDRDMLESWADTYVESIAKAKKKPKKKKVVKDV